MKIILSTIVEPEIDIKNPNKQMLEDALAQSLKDHPGKMKVDVYLN